MRLTVTEDYNTSYGRQVKMLQLESVQTCCRDMARLLAWGLLKFQRRDGNFYYCGRDRDDDHIWFVYCPYCGDQTEKVVLRT